MPLYFDFFDVTRTTSCTNLNQLSHTTGDYLIPPVDTFIDFLSDVYLIKILASIPLFFKK